jgi:hypothetical protein
MGRIMSRRRSDPVVPIDGPSRTSNFRNQGLGHIPEAGESRTEIHLVATNQQIAEVSLLDTQLPDHAGRRRISQQELAQRSENLSYIHAHGVFQTLTKYLDTATPETRLQ